MKEEKEIYKSNIKGKIKFYSYAFILLGLVLLLQSGLLADYLFADTSEYSIEEIISYYSGVANLPIIINGMSFPVYFFMSYVIFNFGRAIHKSKQFPPPNSNMPFSLKIMRGKKAIRQAYGAYVGSAGIMLNWIISFIGGIYMSLSIKELIDSIQ